MSGVRFRSWSGPTVGLQPTNLSSKEAHMPQTSFLHSQRLRLQLNEAAQACNDNGFQGRCSAALGTVIRAYENQDGAFSEMFSALREQLVRWSRVAPKNISPGSVRGALEEFVAAWTAPHLVIPGTRWATRRWRSTGTATASNSWRNLRRLLTSDRMTWARFG
jgi:hypothetical protein